MREARYWELTVLVFIKEFLKILVIFVCIVRHVPTKPETLSQCWLDDGKASYPRLDRRLLLNCWAMLFLDTR